jgi:hypothetical protein
MGNAADFFVHSQERGQPGVRIFQRKTRQHQGDEADEQHDVLYALIVAHPGDRAIPTLAAQDRFTTPDNKIVQQHAADHHSDHAEVELANPAYGDSAYVSGERCIYMHFTYDEFIANPRMTLSAGLDQICLVDSRTRITRRQDVMHAMATGAVSDDLRAQLGSQAVIALQVSRRARAGNSQFLRQTHALMASRAGGARQILRRDR